MKEYGEIITDVATTQSRDMHYDGPLDHQVTYLLGAAWTTRSIATNIGLLVGQVSEALDIAPPGSTITASEAIDVVGTNISRAIVALQGAATFHDTYSAARKNGASVALATAAGTVEGGRTLVVGYATLDASIGAFEAAVAISAPAVGPFSLFVGAAVGLGVAIKGGKWLDENIPHLWDAKALQLEGFESHPAWIVGYNYNDLQEYDVNDPFNVLTAKAEIYAGERSAINFALQHSVAAGSTSISEPMKLRAQGEGEKLDGPESAVAADPDKLRDALTNQHPGVDTRGIAAMADRERRAAAEAAKRQVAAEYHGSEGGRQAQIEAETKQRIQAAIRGESIHESSGSPDERGSGRNYTGNSSWGQDSPSEHRSSSSGSSRYSGSSYSGICSWGQDVVVSRWSPSPSPATDRSPATWCISPETRSLPPTHCGAKATRRKPRTPAASSCRPSRRRTSSTPSISAPTGRADGQTGRMCR